MRTFLRTEDGTVRQQFTRGFSSLAIQGPGYCDFRSGEIICKLYSTQRPQSGCRSSGTDRHLLLAKVLRIGNTGPQFSKYQETGIHRGPAPS